MHLHLNRLTHVAVNRLSTQRRCIVAPCRLSDKLWSEAQSDINRPEQPRLALKAHDQDFFEDILKNPAALDNAAPKQPTTTQQCIWSNLKVGADILCHINASKKWQGSTAFICQNSGENP